MFCLFLWFVLFCVVLICFVFLSICLVLFCLAFICLSGLFACVVHLCFLFVRFVFPDPLDIGVPVFIRFGNVVEAILAVLFLER